MRASRLGFIIGGVSADAEAVSVVPPGAIDPVALMLPSSALRLARAAFDREVSMDGWLEVGAAESFAAAWDWPLPW